MNYETYKTLARLIDERKGLHKLQSELNDPEIKLEINKPLDNSFYIGSTILSENKNTQLVDKRNLITWIQRRLDAIHKKMYQLDFDVESLND